MTVSAAVDELYAAFAAVPRPPAVAHCPCCVTEAEVAALLAPVPLRELPVEAVRPYAANVPFTVGGSNDLRYFAPRVLEIGCADGFGWPGLESLAARLRHAGWADWPAAERAAVRGLLGALWDEALAGDGFDAGTVLCAAGNAEDDVAPYLARWTAAVGRPAAAEQLRDLLWHGCARDPGGRRLRNAFWDGRDAQAAAVLAWLGSDELCAAVLDAGTAGPVLADVFDAL
ncbi:hypothetical protein [Spirilliplanes yamanashiensis]|uniref:Uncharacterized protein n=1 Tax=Spirilliplanes yamanashiensis TaxID=42233 RepID=A0A8J3Y4S9_9ACTN|nr:hypothetical protein [Spirilliplanes yamanashiensis]MDP9819434.1 hypothetical protein [Spirilliplanes yamanashiensis]GIJ01743.1 hypothetical protein Sya03_10950 [Spirilliplanes yamanashiensis]